MKYVISLGGSIVVPKDINTKFLTSFRTFILRHVRSGKQFVIVCGGGATSRAYQAAAKKLTTLTAEDADWLGIHATRLNAHLLRTIFRKWAYPRIVKNPHQITPSRKLIIIGAGWRPGWSTDYCAVLLAKRLGIRTILNISDIDYVYTSDPKKSKTAKPIKRLTWAQFIPMLPRRWSPGLSVPFDPVAARAAARLGLKVVIMGPDVKNVDAFLTGKKFRGTVIQ